MILTYFWCGCILLSAVFAFFAGTGSETASALTEGASSAITICISLSGPLALWSGLGKLMGRLGITGYLSAAIAPVCRRLFPSSRHNRDLAGALGGNICANLLGLGNAATPMGIEAVKRMADPLRPREATDEMCRLIVMNTASIQLLPTTVAAVRASAGCDTPFDILPCVWISSILSVSAGLGAAELLRRVWKDA